MTPLMTERRTAIVGAALVALGPVTMALYTPAMPALVDVFGTSLSTVKLTLTVYFFGFAFAQLICGPLADAFGRRPVTFWFFGLYIAASVGATAAPNIETMLVARLLQGVGAAAGIAISRAIVRDLFVGQASARIMTTIGIMLAIGPAVAPTIGGLLLTFSGWQAIFILMLICGVALTAMMALAVPETLARRDPSKIRPARLVRNYGKLLSDARFMRPALMIGFSLGGIYTLAGLLPFVLIEDLGMTPTGFGLSMMIQSASFIAGSILVRYLLRTITAFRLVAPGLAIALIAAIAMVIGLLHGQPNFWLIMLPVGLWAFGIAFVLPSATTDALAPFPMMAGSASAMMGFMQIAGGLIGTGMAAAFPQPALALATIVPAFAIGAVLAQILLRSRHQARMAHAESEALRFPPAE